MSARKIILILVVLTASIDATVYKVNLSTELWHTTRLYQIWPRFFKDSDGDEIGNLNGRTSKMDRFVDMDIEVMWLSSFYTSPMVDSGYDISNFREVNQTYGTIDDDGKLVAHASELGLEVIVDCVPNHNSDEHE